MRLYQRILLLVLFGLVATPGTCPAQEGSPRTGVLEPPFKHRDGFCWVAELPKWKNSSDRVGDTCRSSLVLMENGKLLRAAHQIHWDVEKIGGGRYSHWGTQVLFASSDNTDPHTNGRSYSYEITPIPWRFPLDAILGPLFLLLVSGCLICPLVLAWLYRRTPAAKWFIGIGLSGLGLTLFLRLNILDPRAWYAVLAHIALILFIILLLSWPSWLPPFCFQNTGPKNPNEVSYRGWPWAGGSSWPG